MWSRASASQIDTWTLCNRRWWFDKIAGREDRSGSASTNLGSEVHQAIEDYLNGITHEPDHLLLAGNTFVRDVRNGTALCNITRTLVEHEFTIDLGGVPALGYIDLVLVDEDARRIYVIDHKTSGNLKYTKDAAALADDTQGRLYCWWAFSHFGPSWEYFFGHHVISTKGAEAGGEGRLTVIGKTHDEIQRGYKILCHQAASMQADAGRLDAAQVDANFGACFKFPPRGCPHKSYCRASKENNMSLFDSIAPPAPSPAASPTYVYLDAMPSRGPVVFWDHFIDGLAATYHRERGEHYLLTAYNEGAKAVARKAWETLTIPAGLVLRSSDPSAVIFANLARGDERFVVVQGVR